MLIEKEWVFQDSAVGGVFLFILFGFWIQWWVMRHTLGNFLKCWYFSGESGNRQFREMKSGWFFHVLCAETVLISLSWRHGRDDHFLTVLEKWSAEEFLKNSVWEHVIFYLIKFCMIIDSFVDKGNFWNQSSLHFSSLISNFKIMHFEKKIMLLEKYSGFAVENALQKNSNNTFWYQSIFI